MNEVRSWNKGSACYIVMRNGHTIKERERDRHSYFHFKAAWLPVYDTNFRPVSKHTQPHNPYRLHDGESLPRDCTIAVFERGKREGRPKNRHSPFPEVASDVTQSQAKYLFSPLDSIAGFYLTLVLIRSPFRKIYASARTTKPRDN